MRNSGSLVHSCPNCELRHPGDNGELIVSAWLAGRIGLEFEIDDVADDRLSRPAALTETTRIYRRLAGEFHPDRNPDGGPTMRALNELMDAVRQDFGATPRRQ